MISEAVYWKAAIDSIASDIDRSSKSKEWNDAALVALEQSVMIGFYSVRKLVEAEKISELCSNMRIELLCWPAKGHDVNRLNWHHIDKLYDFKQRSKRTKKLKFVTNQFIHSYVFHSIWRTKNQISGVAFNSDRTKTHTLFYIGLSQIGEVFRTVAADNLREARRKGAKERKIKINEKDL